MNKQTFINDLSKENSTFSSTRQAEMVANLLDTVSTDMYSESHRFVFELIQNADDAANDINNEVHFDFLSNYLIVSHNGKPFDEKDIISLTSAGVSTKKEDPTKTGYKGIGFKSVFGKSEWVAIFSDDYQFRFEKSVHTSTLPWQIIPIWIDQKDLPGEISNNFLINKYTVSTIIKINKTDSLLKDLHELINNGQILLFLRKISKISVSRDGKYVSSIEKKVLSEETAFSQVTLLKDGREISAWITKSFEKIPISLDTKEALKQDDKTPEKLKQASFTEISFAAKIEEEKLKPLKKEESLIFTYLPTKVSDFEFPFLVNGSFITNASREGLHEDRIWNQWLFKIVAVKLLDWLELLATSRFKFHTLQLLPHKFNSNQHVLKYSFDISLEQTIKEKKFVPSQSLKLKKVSDLIIDKTGIADLNFILPETVIDFINQKEKTTFKKDSFIHGEVHRTEKLRSFGAKFFEAENLEGFFLSPIFKDKHLPTENISLIEYLYNKANKDESREWNERLKQIPFIYGEDNELKSPKLVCFPTINFKTEFGDEVTVIHPEVYPRIESNSKIKNWLEFLGVKEPSETAYLENEIIGNIEKCIDQDNYQRVTRYLFNQHKKALLTDLHYDQLQDLKIFTTGQEFKAAKECYLSDFYEPSLKLEQVNEGGKYVSEVYKQNEDLVSEWKTFFLKIGISENISIIRMKTSIDRNTGVESNYFIEIGEKVKEGHGYPHLVGPTNEVILDKIRYSQFATNYKFSKVFWQQAIKTIHPGLIDHNALMPWGFFGSKAKVNNYFFWSIKNSKIFPSTTKECLLAMDLYTNDKDIMEIASEHLPVFDYDEPLPEEWKSLLPFKEKLEVIDYLTILERITEQTEEDEILRKYNIRKIGLIYNKLTSLLPNFSNEKKQFITSWANNNKLLSATGKFENANELKWIKIDGFRTASEKLKIIQFPKNCEVSSKTFEELISLFQVQIIDKFIPSFENKKQDLGLKNKLQRILPYFVFLIEKKQYTDFTAEFKRLLGILSKSEFFSASEIKLSFKYQTETMKGASLNVFREGKKFYFKEKWRSPIIMFNLIPELSELLEVAGLNDELRLLLQLNEDEIIDWFNGLNYDVANIKAKPEYQLSKQKTQTNISDENDTLVETIPEDIESSNDGIEVVPKFESFDPEVSAQDVDVSSIKTIQKRIINPNNMEPVQYGIITDDTVRFAVGRWSEQFVFKYLSNLEKYSEIIWENKIEESGKSYDFKVIENGTTRFVEVKGTPSAEKDLIYLSSNEWNFMFEQKDNYLMIRVYNAGKANVFPEIIENPSQQIVNGSIQVALRL